MTQFIDTLVGIFQSSGFAQFGQPGGWLYAVMICVGCFLLYLAIVKEFEPLILLPMAFGMILANLPGSGIIHMQYFVGDGLEHPMWVEILNNGGLADMLYMGVKLGIYPPLIFLGIGTMTDVAPLISNPKSLLLGAAALAIDQGKYILIFEILKRLRAFQNLFFTEGVATGNGSCYLLRPLP